MCSPIYALVYFMVLGTTSCLLCCVVSCLDYDSMVLGTTSCLLCRVSRLRFHGAGYNFLFVVLCRVSRLRFHGAGYHFLLCCVVSCLDYDSIVLGTTSCLLCRVSRLRFHGAGHHFLLCCVVSCRVVSRLRFHGTGCHFLFVVCLDYSWHPAPWNT
jgi:hypothetical protein